MAARGIPRLFVGNIPWTIGRKELRDYFAQFGQIQHSHIFFDKSTGMSRNFGFVQFSNREGYVNSSREHDHFLEGNRLTVADVHDQNAGPRGQNRQSFNAGQSSVNGSQSSVNGNQSSVNGGQSSVNGSQPSVNGGQPSVGSQVQNERRL